MKKNLKTAAFFTVLSILAIGCQKETEIDPVSGMQQTMQVRTITYSIDGMTQQTVIRGEADWADFLKQLTALARQGHRVHFRCEETSANAQSSKEVVTYETSNEEEASNWCATMADKGYGVSMYYDKIRRVYVCTAEK